MERARTAAGDAQPAEPERLLAPLRRGKMLLCGVDYPDHANENRNAVMPTELDWDRLTAIRGRVRGALSLHGASGIADADVRRAVSAGIGKVNVNTELRDRYFEVLAERAHTLRDGARLLQLAEELSAAVAEVVAAKLEVLEGAPGLNR